MVKNLELIKCDLKDVIIVDNNPKSYLMHPLNGLPILSWYEDKEDNNLKLITKLLIFLSKVDDVRKYIPKFVANETICFENVDKLIYKSKIELNWEGLFSSKGSTLEDVTPEKNIKLKGKVKTKDKNLNNFYAPDEFISALDRNPSPARKVNQVRLFKINKSSFSNFNYDGSIQKLHQRPSLAQSFINTEIINSIVIDKQKVNQETIKNELLPKTVISLSKVKNLFQNKSTKNFNESPFNILQLIEGSKIEGLEAKEENEAKEANDYLYFE